MNIPFEFKKQYEATKNFVRATEMILQKKVRIFIVSMIIAIALLIAMLMFGGILMIPFLLALAAVYVCYSNVLRVKKDIKEPKILVFQYDTFVSELDDFRDSLKFNISDYFLGNLFIHKVKTMSDVTTDDLLDKLIELEYQPILEFYSGIENEGYDKSTILEKRQEYFLSNNKKDSL